MKTVTAFTVALLAVACGSQAVPAASPTLPPATATLTVTSTPEVHTIVGKLHLIDLTAIDMDSSDNSCSGRNAYAYLDAGLPVVALDESGKTIGATSLKKGETVITTNEVDCVFSFEITGVPRASFYSFKLGTTPTATFSYNDMLSKEWQVDLQIG